MYVYVWTSRLTILYPPHLSATPPDIREMAGEEIADVSSGLKAISKLESDEAEKVDLR